MTMDHHREESRRVLLMGEDRLSLRVFGGLLAEHGFEIVGEAMTEHAALELLGERAPDVAVLDMQRKEESSRAAWAISERSPTVQIVVLTSGEPIPLVVDALLAGACGELPKESPAPQIARGVQMAAAGEAFISDAAAVELLARMRSEPRAWQPFPPSTRELQILRLTARGCDASEIARELTLSERLVGRHLSNMLRKLQLAERVAEAMRPARQIPVAGYSQPQP